MSVASFEQSAKDFAATKLATRAIHAGQEPDPITGAVVTPIYMTSTFKQDGVGGLRNGYDYSRSINPTRDSFDAQLAAIEGAKYALAFSSGLAAIDVLLRSTLKPGDSVLLGNDVYGGTYRLLSKVFVPWGVNLDVVDITDTQVTLDFNHQLAGETVRYQGKVLQVRDATEQELHPHQGCGSCGGSCGEGGCSGCSGCH